MKYDVFISVSACPRWTERNNRVYAGGAASTTSNSLSACQAECIGNTACNGINFSPVAAAGQRCTVFTSSAGAWRDQDNVNYYELHRHCPGTHYYHIMTLLSCRVCLNHDGTDGTGTVFSLFRPLRLPPRPVRLSRNSRSN